MNKKRNRLLSIIVLAAIVLVATAIVFSFCKARETTRRNACKHNLRVISGGKDQYAIIHGLPPGADISWAQIDQYACRFPCKHSSGTVRAACDPYGDCLAGGKYSLNPVGSNPVCSFHGDLLSQDVQ